MDIVGKNIIITGGAKGIGRQLAERLILEGAVVGVFDIDKKNLFELKDKNPTILTCEGDLTDYNQVENFINEYINKYKKVDILVNCAGIIYNSPLIRFGMNGFSKHDLEMWNKVIATNLNGTFIISMLVVEKMLLTRTKGLIINVSSVCASGNAGQSAYSAAKAGVNALTVTWAKELGGWGIRVAGIAPGFTETQTTIDSMNENVIKDWKEKTPIRRFGIPDEIVNGMLFIINNDFFHGRILEIDGGLRI